MNNDTKEVVGLMGWFSLWYVWVIILSILGSVIYMFIYPYFVNQENKIIQNSYGNYKSAVVEMNTYINEYSKLERESVEKPYMAETNKVRQGTLASMVCERLNVMPDNVRADILANNVTIREFERQHPCSAGQ